MYVHVHKDAQTNNNFYFIFNNIEVQKRLLPIVETKSLTSKLSTVEPQFYER